MMPVLPVVGVVWLLLFSLIGYFAARKWWLYIFIVRNQATSTGNAIRGTVELVGKAEPLAHLIAPFSGKRCVYYHYEAKRWDSSGDNSYWRTIRKGSSSAPFLIDDGSGEMKVDPAGAKMHLKPDGIWAPESMRMEGVITLLRDYEEKEGVELPKFLPTTSSGTRLGGRKVLGISVGGELVKYEEYCIRPGDELYVLGTVNHERAISKGKGDFIISDQGEMTVTKKTLLHAFLLSVLMFLLLGGAAFFYLTQMA